MTESGKIDLDALLGEVRAQALEEAALVAEGTFHSMWRGKSFGEYPQFPQEGKRIAAAIRALRDSDGPRMAETNEDSARGEAGPARAEGIAQDAQGEQP